MYGDDYPTRRKSFVSTHHKKQLTITEFPHGYDNINLGSLLRSRSRKLKEIGVTGFHLYRADSEDINGQGYGVLVYKEAAYIDSAQSHKSLSTMSDFFTLKNDTIFSFYFIDMDCPNYNDCFESNKKIMESVIWK
jgi:hypothetical protein